MGRDREANRKYQREYYARNRQDWRRRYEENREQKLEYERQRRQQNAELYRIKDHERYLKNRDLMLAQGRIRRLRADHGLRPDQLAALWDEQDGLCYLCGEELVSREAIDHDHCCCPADHSCQICRRGLAHANCNAAIGFAGDSPERLRAMADALEAAQAAVECRKAEIGEQLAFTY